MTEGNDSAIEQKQVQRTPPIPVKIEKVLELRWSPQDVVYAHIAIANDIGERKEFALIAQFPQHGFTYLGDINPETGRFEAYDNGVPTFYERSGNRVINSMTVPADQLSRTRTLDEVLQTGGMEIQRTLIPE